MILRHDILTVRPEDADAAAATSALDQLRSVADEEIVGLDCGGTGGSIALPRAVVELLRAVLPALARGDELSVVSSRRSLTTQQAADMLGVSRPFVVKEIDRGHLPARRVGTHRRVLFGDLLAYQRRLDADRQRALDELAALDAEMGLD